MIKIQAKRFMTGEYRIRLSGHAGFGKMGEDIVCAGVSALFFALGNVPGVDIHEESGEYVVSVPPGKRQCGEMALSGWRMIAEKYPHCVTINAE